MACLEIDPLSRSLSSQYSATTLARVKEIDNHFLKKQEDPFVELGNHLMHVILCNKHFEFLQLFLKKFLEKCLKYNIIISLEVIKIFLRMLGIKL